MHEQLGKVTIAPNVLVTIVQERADSVPGVAQLCVNIPGVKRLLGLPTAGRGVEANIVDGQVIVDVYLVARRDVDLLRMGRQLQQEITRDMEDIVGMEVREINVHIEDIETELAQPVGPEEGVGQPDEGTPPSTHCRPAGTVRDRLLGARTRRGHRAAARRIWPARGR